MQPIGQNVPDWLQPMQAPQIAPMDFAAPTKAKGGMFGGGKFGLKQAIAFGLAGLVARRNPMLLNGLMGAMMQKQRAEQEEQEYQRRRVDSLDDYRQKQIIDAQYAPPPQPTEFERMVAAAGYVPGTKEYFNVMRQYVHSRANPPYIFTDPTTGRIMSVPRNSAPLPETLSDEDWNMGGPAASPPATFP